MNPKIKKIQEEMFDILPITDYSKELLKKQIELAYQEGVQDGFEKAHKIVKESFSK